MTPSATGYSFTPSSRSLSNIANDQAAQDFAATLTSASAPMYFIQVDHLNTPRVVADQSGQTVWTSDNTEPFGDSAPNENPSGQGAFSFDLAFPGQRRDRESGLFYNAQRDGYNPAIGAYPQPDPAGSVMFGDMGLRNLGAIGLVQPQLGALLKSDRPKYNHLYAYVSGNPTTKTDASGLQSTYGLPWALPPNYVPTVPCECAASQGPDPTVAGNMMGGAMLGGAGAGAVLGGVAGGGIAATEAVGAGAIGGLMVADGVVSGGIAGGIWGGIGGLIVGAGAAGAYYVHNSNKPSPQCVPLIYR